MCRSAMLWLVCATPTMALPCLEAQALGLPSSYRAVMDGFGAAVDAGGNGAGLRTIGVTGIVALGHLTAGNMRMSLFNVSATIARLAGGGSAVGAEVSVLSSFKIAVDRSTWGGLKRGNFALAAAIPVLGCASRKTMVMLYGVPAWNFERVEKPTGASWQPSWSSASIGAILELRSGLGFQLGVGGLSHHPTRDPYHRVVVGVGVHFSPHSILAAAMDGPHKTGTGNQSQSRWECSAPLMP